jgi:hypothetical protein
LSALIEYKAESAALYEDEMENADPGKGKILVIALQVFFEKLGKALYTPLDGFLEFFNGKLMASKFLEALDLIQINKSIMIWSIWQFLEASNNLKLTALTPEIAAGYYKDDKLTESPEQEEKPELAPEAKEEEIEV